MKTRPDHPTIRRWSLHGGLVLLVGAAVILLVAARRPPAGPAGIAGWVVVERSPIGDDTATIQAAIDSVAWLQASTATRVSPDVSTFT